MTDDEFKAIENLANFEATAELDSEQYTVLVTTMTDWCESNKHQEREVKVLKSIKFKRTR